MTFSLHSLSPVYDSTSCYFEVEHNRAIFRSPLYPDKKSALDAIRAWLLGLRANADTNSYLLEEEEVYKLRLFGEASPVTAQDIIFSEKSTASK